MAKPLNRAAFVIVVIAVVLLAAIILHYFFMGTKPPVTPKVQTFAPEIEPNAEAQLPPVTTGQSDATQTQP